MPPIEPSPPHRDWLQSLDQFLEEAFMDPQLRVSDMAAAMSLSDRHFHRKVKNLTGLTPLRYLRQFRLKKAHRLLEAQQVDTVGELTGSVGYIRPDHFSALYRDHFGYTPYEHLQRQQPGE